MTFALLYSLAFRNIQSQSVLNIQKPLYNQSNMYWQGSILFSTILRKNVHIHPPTT